MKQTILLSNNFIEVQKSEPSVPADQMLIATVVSNIVYYGFVPSEQALKAISTLGEREIVPFWKALERDLKALTGADRKMDDFVVYKNFPSEVLNKTEAEYWIAQIFMYLGVANEYFTEEVADREPLLEKKQLKVLHLAKEDTVSTLFEALKNSKNRWTDNQQIHAEELVSILEVDTLDLADFGFKENGLSLIFKNMNREGISYTIADATDVLRLASLMSGGDAALRTHFRFKSFKRSERRMLLKLLDNSKNLLADMAMRPDLWKRFLKALRPGDYQFERVQKAYDSLYKGEYQTFNGLVEQKVAALDSSVLDDLKDRSGDLVRRFHQLYALFGDKAVDTLVAIAKDIDTYGLLKLSKYVQTINTRQKLMFAPKGNWNKVQLADNEKVKLSDEAINRIVAVVKETVSARLAVRYPEGFKVSDEVKNVRLQTNDQRLAEYGRGTVFDIPDNMTFVRSASYWECKVNGNSYFDNGWNFFDDNWKSMDSCCWTRVMSQNKAAIFSGDPTNSKDLKGRACQMIDLYLDKLEALGVRYAVWNILCFSGISFDEASDVLATLQWGENEVAGNLYEPSRAQMVFPLTGKNKTKYVAYIDIKQRKLVYIDADLPGHVQSADRNTAYLEEKMPAYLEYIESLPTVYDLFSQAKEGTIPVVYRDSAVDIKEGKAYVFKPENADNTFDPIKPVDLF